MESADMNSLGLFDLKILSVQVGFTLKSLILNIRRFKISLCKYVVD